MLERIKYIVALYLLQWLYFILQKPVFMFLNAPKRYAIPDFLNVMYHGASLDATTTGYIMSLPFVLIIVSIWSDNMPIRKILTPYYIVVSFMTTLIFVADISLFSFWESKIDASIFIYMDSPKNAMASVSLLYVFLRLLAIVFLSGTFVVLMRKITPCHFKKIKSVKNKLVDSMASLPLAILLFVIIRGGIYVSTANVGNAYFCSDQFLNLSAINPVFNLISSTERQSRYEEEFNFYAEAKRAKVMSGLYDVRDHDTKCVLKTKRPNILLILMESFGGTMIERMGGEVGVAPNLDEISHDGIFFSNAYANSFRTDRGTVCTFSGYPGLPTVSIMKVANLSQRMPNIASELSKCGYMTDFLYGGDINFTNMRGYLSAGGFQKLVSQDDFTLAERSYGKWGVPDNITFERLSEMLEKRPVDKDHPWFTAFLTLSSHEPFEVPFRKFNDDHLNAFAFTDQCVGTFIRRFKESKQWENTLVILLPDHGIPYPKKGERFGPRYFHIPMIWTGGAVREKFVMDKFVNQTDLAATLLAQLGIGHSKFTFSRDVLNDNYVNDFAFYTFVNGFCFLDHTGASVYDNASNRVFYSEGSQTDGVRTEKGKAILQTLYDKLGDMNNYNGLKK